MGISDDDKASLSLFNLLIQEVMLVGGELLRIKSKVLEVLGIEDIHPVVVNWESMSLKIVITLQHDVSTHLSILTKVVAECFNWG